MTLDWLERWNSYSPAGIALQDGESGRQLSYSQLYSQANNGAAFLKDKYQITKGDRIAVLAQNDLDYIVLFFAAQRLGAILVPVNFRLTTREIEHILKDCSPKLLVTGPEYENPGYQTTVLKLTDFSELLLKNSKSYLDFQGEEESPVMILYTSGTTGAPKGAVLTHKMLFWNSVNTSLRLNISQTDSAVIFLPLFHTGGWNVLTTPFLHRGAKVILLKKFDGDLILDLSEKEKCTLLFGVPTTMDMMARSAKFKDCKLSSLRYAIVGGEPMPVNLIETWHAKKIPVRQGYGLTEFGPNVFSLNEQDAIRKIGSIGFPNFYCEARIVDQQNKEVGPGEIGELILRGPMCMHGYWQNEMATKETIVDGWLHTGDLVRRDSEGYHYVVGRKKDMFKSGGENVYPAELEKVLRAIPGVREAAVIGVPDAKWGEVGKAFVVLEEGAPLSESELTRHCTKNLAKFKIPKYFQFLPELPKGDSGKILKRKLAELA
jgi:fatty-acyl-CoA synthase